MWWPHQSSPSSSHAGDNSVLCHMKIWQTGPAVAVRRQSTTPSKCKADKAQTQNNSVFVDLLETINCIQMTVSCRYKPDVENSSAQFNLSPVWLIQVQQQSSGRKRGCVALIILLYETWSNWTGDTHFCLAFHHIWYYCLSTKLLHEVWRRLKTGHFAVCIILMKYFRIYSHVSGGQLCCT